MTNYEKIKDMNEVELTRFLSELGFDDTPWTREFDMECCKECPVMKMTTEDGYTFEASRCEVFEHCDYFPESDGTPSNEEVVGWWLKRTTEV